MAYNTPETVADYLARFQMEITHRGKGTFTPDHALVPSHPMRWLFVTTGWMSS